MKSFLVIFFLMSATLLSAQKAEPIKLNELQEIIQKQSDQVLVVNFWATWCAPCIKELPLFEKLNEEKKATVILVSMDYDLDPNIEKVNRFVMRKKLQSKVFVLTESNPNSWIEKIDKRWSGALPATLVVNTKTGNREFVQGELSEGELEKILLKLN
jgi:thiol-disulfide isomerase/thioredoxin